jgi:hypothetical protein
MILAFAHLSTRELGTEFCIAYQYPPVKRFILFSGFLISLLKFCHNLIHKFLNTVIHKIILPILHTALSLAKKVCGGVNVYILIFLISALVGGEWSASRPGCFNPGERDPGTHLTGGCLDPRAGLDDVEKKKFLTLTGLELQPLSRPARSQSLYRLRCPGSHYGLFKETQSCTVAPISSNGSKINE